VLEKRKTYIVRLSGPLETVADAAAIGRVYLAVVEVR